MRITACRQAHFNCAHRLHNKKWTDEKNKEVYGLCNNPHYHGHNYKLIVKINGDIDPDSGYVIDMKILADIIKSEVEDRYDHKNLNLDCPEFENVVPTAENIAVMISQNLKKYLKENQVMDIVLYETERNFVELTGITFQS